MSKPRRVNMASDLDFAMWLKEVDDLCMRFLDQDLISLPTLDSYSGVTPMFYYERNETPTMFFLELVGQMRLENGFELVDAYIARQAKWGNASGGG